jgi:hypothetical protein
MTSALDIITDALNRLGVYSPGEPLTSADSSLALTLLYDMVDEWVNDNIYLYELVPTVIPLVIGKSAYTLTSRPPRLRMGPGQAALTIGATVTDLNVVSQIEWIAIVNGYPTQGTPETLFYDPQYPFGVVNVNPTPSAIGTVTINGWQPLPLFTVLSTQYAMAEGVEEALKTNLAVRAKPYFVKAETPLDPAIVALAGDSKTTLRQYSMISRAMQRRQRERKQNASGA